MNLDNFVLAAASGSGSWELVLIVSLALSGLLAFGYRAYRLTKGGPMPDAVGGAILALLLGVLAAAVGSDAGWARWAALGYGLTFGIVVTPIWTLAVFIPARPGRGEIAVITLYGVTLLTIVVAALAL